MKTKHSIILSLILIGLTLNSCNKKEVELPPKGETFLADLNILFTNKEGKNILTDDAAANFKLFYIVDEKEKEVLYRFHDNPRSIWSVEANGQKYLRLIPNIEDQSNTTTSILKWGDAWGGDTEIIRTEIMRKPGVLIVTKVWWNDELVWDNEIAKATYEENVKLSRVIKIVK